MSLRRIPSLNWLRVFEAAARFQHFARAAEVLNMSPPAVSQQIRALEQALGRQLFERGPHSVRLTEAGRAFLPAVARALNDIEVSATGLFGLPGGGSVSLRVSSMMAESWLAPRLVWFELRHPGIRLLLGTALYDEEFARHGADLRVTFGTPPGPGEDGDRLFGETIFPVARPEIASEIAAPEHMARHRLIEISTHRANWQLVLSRAGVAAETPTRITYTDTTSVAFAMAASGYGLALARAPATDGLQQAHGLVPCLDGFLVPGLQHYHLVYPSRAGLTRAAATFREWLLTQVAAQE